MLQPKLALPNFFGPPESLRAFALEHGFDGVEWTLSLEDLPRSRAAENDLIQSTSLLSPLEVRYHCFFRNIDLGSEDLAAADHAKKVFFRTVDLVHRLRGRFMTIHVGLGRESMDGVEWDTTVRGLSELVRYATLKGIRVCLENLASGWTSRPTLYEKLVRKSRAWATLDMGHAAACDPVTSRVFDVGDFVEPHRDRVLSSHVYHMEVDGAHVPPSTVADVESRLDLLRTLPLCDWWVLELRNEPHLIQTLGVIREYLLSRRARQAV